MSTQYPHPDHEDMISGEPRAPTDPVREALARLYAATVRAEATRVPISYEHFAMVDARSALAAQPAEPAQPEPEPEPEPEPVAWIRGLRVCISIENDDSMRADGWHPLYLTPPAPQPLTDAMEALRQLADAMEYHIAQTRLIHASVVCLEQARAVLAAAEQKP
jgi:pyruvate/2-oxoglutarate dehydrogenase complex dihydrolipoamide acyltransferase (E2) component